MLEQIRLVRSESKIDHDFTILWVPRRTLVSDQILEEHGVLGEANIVHFPLYFVPLEQDVLSLELEESLSDLCLVRMYARFDECSALLILGRYRGKILHRPLPRRKL